MKLKLTCRYPIASFSLRAVVVVQENISIALICSHLTRIADAYHPEMLQQLNLRLSGWADGCTCDWSALYCLI